MMLLSAVLLALAYPWPGLSFLAFVALVPVVWLAIRAARRWRLIWTSYLVAVLWWLWMVAWLSDVTVGGYVVLCMIAAVYTPVTLLAIRAIHRRFPAAMTMVVPMVWVTMELLRSRLIGGGFEWFLLGHSQGAYAPGQIASRIAQVADLFGVPGVTFIIAMTNGLIVDFIVRRWSKPGKLGRRRISRTLRASLAAWVVVIVAAVSYGQWRISQTNRLPADMIDVAVVQTNVPQSNKNRPTSEQVVNDFESLLQLTDRAANAVPDPELIIWPETAAPAALNRAAVIDSYELARSYEGVSGDDLRNSRSVAAFERMAEQFNVTLDQLPQVLREWNLFYASTRDRIAAQARAADAAIVVGAPARKLPPDDDRTNAAYLVTAAGDFADARYDKMQLVPFGEYLPWVGAIPALKDWFIRYLTPYDHDYTLQAGREAKVFTVEGEDGRPVRFVTPICYEDVVARVMVRMMRPENGRKPADLIVNLTNSAWYIGGSQRPQHLQIASFRSIEHRTPTARAVNTGISGVIDSAGRIVTVVERDGGTQRVAGVVSAGVGRDPRTSMFTKLGHIPAWLLAMGTVILVIAGLIRGPRWSR